MRAIMVMYDSLRRDLLPCYNKNTPLEMPNFRRLAEHSLVFDRSYVCSMPCMPTRRELHTGRPNFLHRSWGPVEPWDDSMPEILDRAGIHSHLSTDHYHYIQDGGATYCGRYSTWACYRGQESDAWQGFAGEHEDDVSPYLLFNEKTPEAIRKRRAKGGWRNYENRKVITEESLFPQAKTFEDGLDFIRKNSQYDNWFLQIETFDPHEPFTAPEKFQSRWFDPDKPFMPDWPPYSPVMEDQDTIEQMRRKYYALSEYCDYCLGLVLDEMDEKDMWKDTMLIVNTDHGFFLGEHDWWGKGSMPDYEELTHTPFFLWDPRSGKQGERRSSLVQTIDIAPTLLDFFELPIPKDMIGRPLKETAETDKPVRDYAIFGYHGGPINITDGRFVYMRAVADGSGTLNDYTLMPTHMDCIFSTEELKQASFYPPFSFTKGCPVLKIPAGGVGTARFEQKLKENRLYDIEEDPNQKKILEDPVEEKRLVQAMAALLKENDAPNEIYQRYGLKMNEACTA